MEALINGESWLLGNSLGSGGFGRVYEAVGQSQPAVVKLVPKDPGAHRELLLANDLSEVPNVVPVLGVGEAGDHWAIAMRRAQKSLRDFLVDLARPLTQAEAIPILVDVAQALVSLESKGIVHRDLKPENLLLFEGNWCLTDFGISRYAEATTAVDTRKDSRTRQYAAPEQWRDERATSATDVYAVGVVAYELLMGSRPFNGPDFRHQHLHETPRRLAAEVDTPLRAIVDECLYKAPQARPRPRRLLKRLQDQSSMEAPSGGAAALLQANQRLVAEISERERLRSAARSESERRKSLLDAAKSSYEYIGAKLLDVVSANTSVDTKTWPIRLGEARLSLSSDLKVCPAVGPSSAGSGLPFDVITHAEIVVDQSSVGGSHGGNYSGRRHSLWFCNAQETEDYTWFETAFMENIFVTRSQAGGFQVGSYFYPLALGPDDLRAQAALRRGGDAYQIAWPFMALRDNQLADFVDRWATWLAQAQAGALRKPTHMPERAGDIEGSYRH